MKGKITDGAAAELLLKHKVNLAQKHVCSVNTNSRCCWLRASYLYRAAQFEGVLRLCDVLKY